MIQDARCEHCHKADETISHCLRDCDEAVNVWVRLVPRTEWNNFFSLPFDQWLLSNLRQSKVAPRFQASWNLVFGVCCWLLWTWRNRDLFDEQFQGIHDPYKAIFWKVHQFKVSKEAAM